MGGPEAFLPALLARADAMQFRGTFEAHLTIEADSVERTAAFRAACDELDVKCVLIELARGQTRSQPMTASYHRGLFGDVVREVQALHAQLVSRGFVPVRVKVEAVVPAEGLTDRDIAAFPDGYFEFHAKLRLPPDADVEALQRLCVAHGAHLSRNDRKRDPRGAAERFVTLRAAIDAVPHASTHQAATHDATSTSASERASALFERLVAALEAAGHSVIGMKRELTVYDGLVELDAGWLPRAVP